MKQLSAFLLFLILAGCGGQDDDPAAGLPGLDAQPNVTVAGVSSGAYLAGQYHVAWSESVTGAGLIAGGPWGCAGGDIAQALGPCAEGSGLDLPALVQDAGALAAANAIDPLDGLDGDSVFVFHGANDAIVPAATTRAAADFYSGLDADIAVSYIEDVPATHGIPVLESPLGCTEFAAPFLNDCDYDLAGQMLETLYGPLQPRSDDAVEAQPFDQAPYAASGLADTGYVFVPQACRGERRCRVHVFLHGCSQSAEAVGTAVVNGAGFNEWAVTNDLIVLYPQVAASAMAPVNPLGCWDWWGYSGENYLERDAAQLAAIHRMVTDLQSP